LDWWVQESAGKLTRAVICWWGCGYQEPTNKRQFLSLYGCQGVTGDIVESRNREIWGIKECIPPQKKQRTLPEDDPTIIEVDPAYMDDDE